MVGRKLLVKCNGTSLAIALSFFPLVSAQAQIVPDSTLPVNSQVTNNSNTSIINGGAIRGTNLFHSFREFSLTTGGTAHFNNSLSIQNIFSRVTGNSISNIDGILKANGSANLFFLNPRGVVFGANARLNLGGSFLATTADRVNFADGTVFSAKQQSPILTVSLPVSLGLNNKPGEIRVVGNGHQLFTKLFSPISTDNNPLGLQVLPGKTLALIGGDVFLNGGVVIAPGGRIEVGSIKKGEVAFDTKNSRWSFDYRSESSLGKIELSNKALLDTSGNGGAYLGIYGQQIVLKNDSVALMQNRGVLPDEDLKLEATELIDISSAALDGTVPGGLFAESTSLGSGAQVILFSPDITVRDGGIVASRNFNSAKGGNVSINAPSSLNITGTSPIDPRGVSIINTLTFGSSAAGNIDISTSNLTLSAGGRLGSATFGEGTGGDVSVKADLIQLTGFEPQTRQVSTIRSGSSGRGDAGSLTINARQLILTNGGSINTSTSGSGNGGNLTINTDEFIEVSGTVPDSTLFSSINAGAFLVNPQLREIFRLPPIPSGSSGNLTINTPQLRVRRNGLISVRNEGTGNAGTLSIYAPQIFLNSGGSITAATVSGNGGEISINSSDFRLDNASITVTAGNNGNGGNININIDALVLDNSSITASAFSGNGGNININTAIFLQRNSEVTASSQLGVDGTVEINEILEPNSVFGITPATQILDRKVVTTSCSLSSPKFYIRQSDRVPAMPDSLEFTPDPNPNIEANTMVTKPDGTVALIYVSPKAFGHPDPCSN